MRRFRRAMQQVGRVEGITRDNTWWTGYQAWRLSIEKVFFGNFIFFYFWAVLSYKYPYVRSWISEPHLLPWHPPEQLAPELPYFGRQAEEHPLPTGSSLPTPQPRAWWKPPDSPSHFGWRVLSQDWGTEDPLLKVESSGVSELAGPTSMSDSPSVLPPRNARNRASRSRRQIWWLVGLHPENHWTILQ